MQVDFQIVLSEKRIKSWREEWEFIVIGCVMLIHVFLLAERCLCDSGWKVLHQPVAQHHQLHSIDSHLITLIRWFLLRETVDLWVASDLNWICGESIRVSDLLGYEVGYGVTGKGRLILEKEEWRRREQAGWLGVVRDEIPSNDHLAMVWKERIICQNRKRKKDTSEMAPRPKLEWVKCVQFFDRVINCRVETSYSYRNDKISN